MTADVLTHRVDGNGEPLLLLNGGMMTVSSWDVLVPSLASRYRVVRCDLRGQLLSPGPPPATFPGHAADVVRLLDHLGLDDAHVLGTSFGAEVGLYLAALHPRRVRSLVATTASDRFQEGMAAPLRRLRTAARRAAVAGERLEFFARMLPIVYSEGFLAHRGEALLADLRERAARLPAEWFLDVDALLASLETLDLTPRLTAVRCPTLIVTAALDAIMPATGSAALARGIPGAREVIVPACGHALVVEQPERLVALATSFLDALAAPPPRAAHSHPPGGPS